LETSSHLVHNGLASRVSN